MNHVDISTGYAGYKHRKGRSHWYHLKYTCKNCIENDLENTLIKLVKISIEQHY